MPGVLPYRRLGPATFEANVAITGGMVVEPDGTTGKIKPAAAGSAVALGVAADDAAPTSAQTSLNYGTARPDVAVYHAPCETRCTYAANTVFGAKVKTAANGQVTPWVSGTDASALVVGICTEPAGVLAAAVGRIRLV